MIKLTDNIARIEALLAENNAASLTYAALECRLAIELICYDRLKISHKYISPKDVKDWRPQKVVDFIVEEVSSLATQEFTLSISTSSTQSTSIPITVSEYEGIEYVEVGKQIGFNPKQIGSLWYAFGNFLHVAVPKSNHEVIYEFANSAKITAKIEAALSEIKRISIGNLLMGGSFSDVVYFDCDCGVKNKRSAELLKDGQIVSCMNVKCAATFSAIKDKEANFIFERRMVKTECLSCNKLKAFDESSVVSLGLNRIGSFTCDCGDVIHMGWKLMSFKKI
jgi:hypothetical protein